MSDKKKLVGKIVFALDSSKSQIYWKCPVRGCTQIHYFIYSPKVKGATSIYQKNCLFCNKAYTASLLNVAGTVALLALVFDGE